MPWNPDLGAVQVGAVIEVQGAPHPVHAPPVPRRPGVITLPGNGIRLVGPPVRGDSAGHGAGDLVPGGHPVLVRVPAVCQVRSIVNARPARPRRAAAQTGSSKPRRCPRSRHPDRSAADRWRPVAEVMPVPTAWLGSAGSGACKSSIATVGIVRTAQQRVDPACCWLGTRPEADPAADPLLGIGEVEIPALVPQRVVLRRVEASSACRAAMALADQRHPAMPSRSVSRTCSQWR